MSLDSNFMIDTRASPEEIRTLLLETGFFERGEDFNDRKVLEAPGLSASIYSPPIRINALRQAGISASVSIQLTNVNHLLTYDWTRNSVRAVVVLLHAYRGDALFLYCTDSAALMRRGGRIILNRRAGIWEDGVEPNVLSLIDLPYEWGDIPGA